MELNKIWNEDNLITMKNHIDENSIDLILTSPFYNSTGENHKGVMSDDVIARGGKYNGASRYGLTNQIFQL